MRSNKIRISIFIMIFVIIANMPYIQAFSTFVPGNYAITFEKDDAISSAKNTLSENIHNLKFIEYDSLKYRKLTHRIIQPVVWIGHGNEYGLSTSDGELTWEDFSKDLHSTPSLDIVLSC